MKELFDAGNIFIVLMIALTILCFVQIIHIIAKIKYIKNETELERYNIEINSDINADIDTELEIFIAKNFDEYCAVNLFFADVDYIKDDHENKIKAEVGELIANRISPVFLRKLSLYYNTKNISDIIAKKLYLNVMNFVIEKNKEK